MERVLPEPLSSQARRRLREATKTPAGTLRRVKTSLAQMGDTNCWPGSSQGERSKEQASFEKSFSGTGPKAGWTVQTQLEEGSLVWWNKNFCPPDQAIRLEIANAAHRHQALEVLLSRRFWKANQVQTACIVQQENGHKHAAEASEDWFRVNKVLEPKRRWQCSSCFVVCPRPPEVLLVSGHSWSQLSLPERTKKNWKVQMFQPDGDQAASANDWPAEGKHSRKHLFCMFFCKFLPNSCILSMNSCLKVGKGEMSKGGDFFIAADAEPTTE